MPNMIWYGKTKKREGKLKYRQNMTYELVRILSRIAKSPLEFRTNRLRGEGDLVRPKTFYNLILIGSLELNSNSS